MLPARRGAGNKVSRTPQNPEICPPSSERTEDLSHSKPLGIIASNIKQPRGGCADSWLVRIRFSCPKLVFGRLYETHLELMSKVIPTVGAMLGFGLRQSESGCGAKML